MTTAPMDPATISVEKVKELLDWELTCSTKSRRIKYFFGRWIWPRSGWEDCSEAARWIAYMPCCADFYYACQKHFDMRTQMVWTCASCDKIHSSTEVSWKKI